MIHLLVIALLAVSTWAGFECPPARNIFPCQCFNLPYDKVQCDGGSGVINFATVRLYLEGKFSQTIPNLRLYGIQTFSVPARALGDLSVRSLAVIRSNIRRIDMDAFEGQASMMSLVLAYTWLDDIPTEALQHVNSLQSLDLEGNILTRITDRAFENLNDLEILKFSRNRISEIDKNAFPKNLKELFIEWNHLSTLNGSLNGLEHLETIIANDNEIVNIRGELDGLRNLKILNLDGNNISDISDTFLNLTSITHLSLSNNRIGDVGISLSNLINLIVLDLVSNNIKELHWTFFENVKDLRILNLSYNFLKTVCPTRNYSNHDGLPQFPDTPELDCFHNMKSLSVLHLSHNRLVNIDAISQYPLPALQSFRLDHNQLSTLGKEMTYAMDLRYLDISYNNFTSLNASYLTQNKELARLGLEGNPWICTEDLVLMVRDLENRGVAIDGRPDC